VRSWPSGNRRRRRKHRRDRGHKIAIRSLGQEITSWLPARVLGSLPPYCEVLRGSKDQIILPLQCMGKNRMVRYFVLTIALGLALGAARPVAAKQVRAGVLSYDVAAGWGWPSALTS